MSRLQVGVVRYPSVAAAIARALGDSAQPDCRVGHGRVEGPIWLGVQDRRPSAIRAYLAAQFAFLHPPDSDALAERWRHIFDRLGQEPDEQRWRRSLDSAPRRD